MEEKWDLSSRLTLLSSQTVVLQDLSNRDNSANSWNQEDVTKIMRMINMYNAHIQMLLFYNCNEISFICFLLIPSIK